MKCRCKSKVDMIEMCRYEKEAFANIDEYAVRWCKNCGRIVKVCISSSSENFQDWYEPKSSLKNLKREFK